MWSKAKQVDVTNVQDFEQFLKSLSPRKKNCGRKMIPLAVDKMKAIPAIKRGSLRCLEAMLITHSNDCTVDFETGKCECKPLPGHCKTSLQVKLKKGLFKRVSSSVRPLINDGNRKVRVVFIIRWVDPDSLPHSPTFYAMYYVIHIDEKWFYITLVDRTYYLCNDEAVPTALYNIKVISPR